MKRFTIVISGIIVFCVSHGSLAAGNISLDSLVRRDLLRLEAMDRPVSVLSYEKIIMDSVLNYSKEFVGAPYFYRNRKRNKPGSIDCSQLISRAFGKYGFDLPPSSLMLSGMGEEVDIAEVQKGDMLFFKGRNRRSKRIAHVALVLDREGENISIIHATRRGVVIDDYTASPYYQKRLIKARRLNLQLLTEPIAENQ